MFSLDSMVADDPLACDMPILPLENHDLHEINSPHGSHIRSSWSCAPLVPRQRGNKLTMSARGQSRHFDRGSATSGLTL
jgi:hypothetical protein